MPLEDVRRVRRDVTGRRRAGRRSAGISGTHAGGEAELFSRGTARRIIDKKKIATETSGEEKAIVLRYVDFPARIIVSCYFGIPFENWNEFQQRELPRRGRCPTFIAAMMRRHAPARAAPDKD